VITLIIDVLYVHLRYQTGTKFVVPFDINKQIFKFLHTSKWIRSISDLDFG